MKRSLLRCLWLLLLLSSIPACPSGSGSGPADPPHSAGGVPEIDKGVPRDDPNRVDPPASATGPAQPASTPATLRGGEEPGLLPLGQVVYNPPAEMQVGHAERIEVRVNQNLLEDITGGLTGPGKPQVEPHRISNDVEVELSSDGPADAPNFHIVEHSQRRQTVDDQTARFTQWSYDVTPRRAGQHRLHLRVTVYYRVGDQDRVKSYAPIDRQIRVKVSPLYTVRQFIVDNWQWLAGTLVIPLGLWGWSKLAERRRGGKGKGRAKKGG